MGTKHTWSGSNSRCFITRKETLEATEKGDEWAPRASMDNLENSTRFYPSQEPNSAPQSSNARASHYTDRLPFTRISSNTTVPETV